MITFLVVLGNVALVLILSWLGLFGVVIELICAILGGGGSGGSGSSGSDDSFGGGSFGGGGSSGDV